MSHTEVTILRLRSFFLCPSFSFLFSVAGRSRVELVHLRLSTTFGLGDAAADVYLISTSSPVNPLSNGLALRPSGLGEMILARKWVRRIVIGGRVELAVIVMLSCRGEINEQWPLNPGLDVLSLCNCCLITICLMTLRWMIGMETTLLAAPLLLVFMPILLLPIRQHFRQFRYVFITLQWFWHQFRNMIRR